MLDPFLLTPLFERMNRLHRRSVAVFEARQGKLSSVIRQDVTDPERKECQTPLEKIARSGFVLVFVNPKTDEPGRPIHRNETVAPDPVESGKVEAIEVEEARRRHPEGSGFLFSRFLGSCGLRQAMNPLPNEQTMNAETPNVRQPLLSEVGHVVERQPVRT